MFEETIFHRCDMDPDFRQGFDLCSPDGVLGSSPKSTTMDKNNQGSVIAYFGLPEIDDLIGVLAIGYGGMRRCRQGRTFALRLENRYTQENEDSPSQDRKRFYGFHRVDVIEG